MNDEISMPTFPEGCDVLLCIKTIIYPGKNGGQLPFVEGSLYEKKITNYFG